MWTLSTECNETARLGRWLEQTLLAWRARTCCMVPVVAMLAVGLPAVARAELPLLSLPAQVDHDSWPLRAAVSGGTRAWGVSAAVGLARAETASAAVLELSYLPRDAAFGLAAAYQRQLTTRVGGPSSCWGEVCTADIVYDASGFHMAAQLGLSAMTATQTVAGFALGPRAGVSLSWSESLGSRLQLEVLLNAQVGADFFPSLGAQPVVPTRLSVGGKVKIHRSFSVMLIGTGGYDLREAGPQPVHGAALAAGFDLSL